MTGLANPVLVRPFNGADVEAIATLFTEAIDTPRPFFESKGFQVVREQEVELRGVRFHNFVMEKLLEAANGSTAGPAGCHLALELTAVTLPGAADSFRRFP